MTTGQVWIALILGFIVLITFASRFRSKGSPLSRRSLDKVESGQQELAQDVSLMRQELAQVRDQLSSLQRILEQVE